MLLRAIPEAGVVGTEDFRTVRTGLGQIPSLHIGQRWRDQQPVGVAPQQRFQGRLNFTPENWRLIEARERLASDNEPRYLIPPFAHRLTAGMLGSRCLAFGYKGVPDAIIVPCLEIARAWYLRSTKLALRLTSAPISEAKRRIFNDAYKAVGDGGESQVVLRTGLAQTDALAAAMLACDQLAAERAGVMMDSLARAASRRMPAFMEALPPVQGMHPVRGSGKWFESGGQMRFLLCRFQAVPFPPIGNVLGWDLDATNQSEPGDRELRATAWPKRPTSINGNSDMILRHESEPNTMFAEVHEFGRLPEFIGAPSLQRLPPREQKSTHGASAPPADPPPGDELSTGAGTSAPGSPGALRTQDTSASGEGSESKDRRNIIPAGFEQLIKVSEELNRREGFQCRCVSPDGETSGPPNAPRSLFPDDSGFRGRWHKIDGRARQYLAVEVETDGLYAYLIEIERRRPSSERTKSSESFSLGIMAREHGEEFAPEDMHEVAKGCVIAKGVWPARIKDKEVKKVRHAFSEQSRFVDAIIRAVDGLLFPEEGANDVEKDSFPMSVGNADDASAYGK